LSHLLGSLVAVQLWTEATYVGFDLETTGISPFSDSPVSYGFVTHHHDMWGLKVTREGGLVNPGVPIPEGASAIHGISDAMVADAPLLKDVVDDIANTLSALWRDGAVVVGMNVSYDLTMIDSLCHRLGLPTLKKRGAVGPVMDILILDRHFDKWRKGSRRLTDLCGQYGVILDSAHSASADAEASLEIFEVMLGKFPEIEIIPLPKVNAVMRTWYREWLSSFSAYLVKKGETPVEVGRFAWPIHENK
jgi:DNA polymerase III subunit epsilon